jgi:hypothetical protein
LYVRECCDEWCEEWGVHYLHLVALWGLLQPAFRMLGSGVRHYVLYGLYLYWWCRRISWSQYGCEHPSFKVNVAM